MTEQDPDYLPSVDVPCGANSAALPVPNLGEPELVVATSVEEAAREAAERIAASLIAAVEQRGRVRCAQVTAKRAGGPPEASWRAPASRRT